LGNDDLKHLSSATCTPQSLSVRTIDPLKLNLMNNNYWTNISLNSISDYKFNDN